MSEARTRPVRLVTAAVIAVLASLLLPALSGTAEAALPTKNTTYKDSSIQGPTYPGTITIKVGQDKRKIAKLTIVADCDGEKEKFTRRNVAIKDNGSFSISSGLFVSIQGKFKTKHKVTGSVTTDQCSFFGGEFVAKD